MSGQTTNKPNHGSASTSHYTIEIKDSYLPPWITSSVCDAIRSNNDTSFEARYTTFLNLFGKFGFQNDMKIF